MGENLEGFKAKQGYYIYIVNMTKRICRDFINIYEICVLFPLDNYREGPSSNNPRACLADKKQRSLYAYPFCVIKSVEKINKG